MRTDFSWYQEGRILGVCIAGDVTLQQLEEAITHAVFEIDRVGQPPYVHVVFDIQHVTQFPIKIADVNKIVGLFFENPRIGWSLLIGKDPVQKYVWSTTAQFYESRWRLLPDVDAALKFLNHVDQTL